MAVDTDEKERGLEARYHVKKIDDPTGKHDDCPCFVLDLKHDPLARSAALSYASAAMEAGYEELARDLISLVGEMEARDRHASLVEELDRRDSENKGGFGTAFDQDGKRI